MTDPWSAAPPAAASDRWASRQELRAAAVVVAVLAVGGALLGLLWEAISPRTKGFVYLPHAIVADESESLVAADGRFLMLTCAAGFVVALAAWSWRSTRGPVVAVALGFGSLLGALLTDLVGRAVGGGHDDGPLNTTLTLPLSVHARGLLLAEGVVGLVVYGAFVLFARHDDLNATPVASDVSAAGPPAGPPPGPPPWPQEPVRTP